MKISVCTDSVFNKIPTAEAMRVVRDCCIPAVEFWSWWDKDLDAIDRARRELNLEIAAFCTRYFELTEPAARGEYLAGLRESIAVAKRLGCTRLISQTGGETSAPRARQHQSIVDGLRECAPILEGAGITLVIEPLNTRYDHRGYYLWSSDEGAEIIDEVGSGRVKLLFDFYHQQIMEGDIVRRSTGMLDKIGHFHAAGTPGRHEPELGEVNYRYVFDTLAEKDYDGFVGLEYFPLHDPAEGLKRWAGVSR